MLSRLTRVKDSRVWSWLWWTEWRMELSQMHTVHHLQQWPSWGNEGSAPSFQAFKGKCMYGGLQSTMVNSKAHSVSLWGEKGTLAQRVVLCSTSVSGVERAQGINRCHWRMVLELRGPCLIWWVSTVCMESSPKDLIHGLSMGPRSQQNFKCSKAILTVEPKKTHGYKMDR